MKSIITAALLAIFLISTASLAADVEPKSIEPSIGMTTGQSMAKLEAAMKALRAQNMEATARIDKLERTVRCLARHEVKLGYCDAD